MKGALTQQEVSVEQRARLLDEVDYATRVADSKRTVVEQVAKVTRLVRLAPRIVRGHFLIFVRCACRYWSAKRRSWRRGRSAP